MLLTKIVFVLTMILSQITYANQYLVGEKLPTISLYDQYNKAGFINEQTQIILFSRDKVAGDQLNSALSNIPDNYLPKYNIVFISDISQMPGLISKYIAIPSMRKKNYSILLDRDGNNTHKFPGQIDKVTVINIESLQIKTITYMDSINEIKQILKLK